MKKLKTNLKSKIKSKKAITLIALVITIVVLIILASVAMYMSLGENGIFNRAKQARNDSNQAEATEKINIKITTAQIESYGQKGEMPTLKELAEIFKQDEDFQYVTEISKVAEEVENIISDNPSMIYTKLKAYDYEFGINNSLQLASVNGVKIANTNSGIISLSEIFKSINVKLEEIGSRIDVTITPTLNAGKSNDDIWLYMVMVNGKGYSSTSNTTVSINNIEPSTEYKVIVYAVDRNIGMIKSEEKSLITSETIYAYLYKDGDQCTSATGGWQSDKQANCDINLTSNNYLYAYAQSCSYDYGVISTKNKINVSGYNKLCADIEVTGPVYETGGTHEFGLANSMTILGEWTKSKKIEYEIGRKVHELDVSGMQGSYYITFAKQLRVKIYKVWFE